jgi:tripartite-type tricarboxylate transporter receptor subunit TctC
MRFARAVASSLFGLLLAAAGARAQDYPNRPITLVLPLGAGGAMDVLARGQFEPKLKDILGKPVIIENRTGGGTVIAATYVAKSAPDGYTLFFVPAGTLTTNATLYKSLPYDPAKDFAPIALFGVTPLVLMVANDVPAKNVQELIALAKAKPGTLTFGSAGIGTTPHLAGELLKSMTGINITHVPFRGTGPAMNDLIGGHIQMFFDLLPTSLPQIQAGKVRAIANAGETRPPALKDLPTVAEQGLPGFSVSSWYGFVAPSKMPEPAKARLIAATEKVLKSPDIVQRMRDLGSEPGNAFGADFATFMQAETKKWGDVIRKSGAHVD